MNVSTEDSHRSTFLDDTSKDSQKKKKGSKKKGKKTKGLEEEEMEDDSKLIEEVWTQSFNYTCVHVVNLS